MTKDNLIIAKTLKDILNTDKYGIWVPYIRNDEDNKFNEQTGESFEYKDGKLYSIDGTGPWTEAAISDVDLYTHIINTNQLNYFYKYIGAVD